MDEIVLAAASFPSLHPELAFVDQLQQAGEKRIGALQHLDKTLMYSHNDVISAVDFSEIIPHLNCSTVSFLKFELLENLFQNTGIRYTQNASTGTV